MDAFERAIPAPQVEISMDGRARRQVFRNRTPLATCRQNIHEAVHHLAHDHRALVAAALGGRDQRLNKRPFVISQIAGIAQEATIITSAVVSSSTWAAPPNRAATLESQMIHPIQELPGQTLRPQQGVDQVNQQAGSDEGGE